MYLSAIAIDFGSTNSGAARIDTVKDGRLIYSTPQFCHTDGHYAKDPTWFWIHPDLLNKAVRDYNSLKDEDFRILSRNSQKTTNPNIVWGSDFLVMDGPGNLNKLISENWVEFKYFKMMIYLDVPYSHNNNEYPIGLVVKLFMRILKIECLSYESSLRKRNVSADEIQWGITIPSIWTSSNKQLMTSICTEVFGSHVRILSEPEGPVISERIHAEAGQLVLTPGRRSLVIDIGGGTTDICLLEDNGESEDAKFKQLASCDGVGVGGNIIDKDFSRYLVRFLSKGLRADDNTEYDSLSDSALYKTLMGEFISNPINALIMEKAWLNYKHGNGVTASYSIPKQYLIWLKTNGHKEVSNRTRDLICGDISIPKNEIDKLVYGPTFNKITKCVLDFVKQNKDIIQSAKDGFYVVFAGGLSLCQQLRDLIISEIRKELNVNVNFNLANTPLLASGSIMDGAAYVLLYRKSISRISPYYIYDPMGNLSLGLLRQSYKDLGFDIKLGELNTLSETDLTSNDAMAPSIMAVPIAIKNEPFKDYSTGFTAGSAVQKAIKLQFYAAHEIVVHPFNNKHCWILGEDEISNSDGDSFKCLIDFNESTNSGNLHYYVENLRTHETKEGNIQLKEKQ